MVQVISIFLNTRWGEARPSSFDHFIALIHIYIYTHLLICLLFSSWPWPFLISLAIRSVAFG